MTTALLRPNTILTPHLAWLSPDSEFAASETAARAIAAVLSSRTPQHPGAGGREGARA
jgi:phosphoglycerate dehydrogenase-like enzyme